MERYYTRRGVLGAVASDGTRGTHSLAGAVCATMDLVEKLFCSCGSCPFGEKTSEHGIYLARNIVMESKQGKHTVRRGECI